MRPDRNVFAGSLLIAVVSLALVGCTGTPGGSQVAPARLRIGTLPTEDTLPLWVAQRDGLFKKAGLTVDLYTFPSAQDRDAAFTSGKIDGFHGDLIAASAMRSQGVRVKVVSIMLGATAKEGRFGIVVRPGSKVKSLTELAGVPIATSTGTIQEYVAQGLMREAGVPAAQVKEVEVNKVAVRFELLMRGEVAAAALPEPLLSLAVQQGARLVADDTGGANLSQTVLAFSQDYLETPAGSEAVKRLLNVWDQAVSAIAADPESFRALSVDKAFLPEPLAKTYRVAKFSRHQLPTAGEVADVLSWMKGAGLLRAPVTYSELMWNPVGG